MHVPQTLHRGEPIIAAPLLQATDLLLETFCNHPVNALFDTAIELGPFPGQKEQPEPVGTLPEGMVLLKFRYGNLFQDIDLKGPDGPAQVMGMDLDGCCGIHQRKLRIEGALALSSLPLEQPGAEFRVCRRAVEQAAHQRADVHARAAHDNRRAAA